jgi:hypothetical protein
MVSTRKQKQAVVEASNPLTDAGILQQVFAFLPGNSLFLGAVCKEWKRLYVGTAGQQFEVYSVNNSIRKRLLTCDLKTTLCSATVASPATARLAFVYGLQIRSKTSVQFSAGLYADVHTLATLRALGMPLGQVVIGAVALSGRLDVLQHLLSDQRRPKPYGLSRSAAIGGSISMLQWLKAEKWCAFDESTCTGAAQAGQPAALQYLRSTGCKWAEQDIAFNAAFSGSIEVEEWLRQQQGIVIDARALTAAAAFDHIVLCEHLRSAGCELQAIACHRAAARGPVGTLRWLRENGCPWDVSEVVNGAARNGCTNVLDFVIEQGEVLDAEVLSKALNGAGVYGNLQAAQWLRQHGAQWPAILSWGVRPFMRQWSGDVLVWARAEGCTSPVIV